MAFLEFLFKRFSYLRLVDVGLDWLAFAWLKRGKRRVKTLGFLAEQRQPITATQLKKAHRIDITQAAFTLNELRNKSLLRCLNENDHRHKRFVITTKGRRMLQKLKERRIHHVERR